MVTVMGSNPGYLLKPFLLYIKLFSGMENVAEHINEMQRIHEEYGAIFDHLYRQYQRSTSQLHELNPGDLLYYGGVEWLNISGFLGKIKKGLELHAMCFIFRTAVVFLCKERLRSKRKQLLVSSLKNLLGQCFGFIFVYLFKIDKEKFIDSYFFAHHFILLLFESFN